MSTASIRDVAERAGVSVGTVSNVLNGPDMVSPTNRDRVQTAVADLGFVRNESARQLRAGHSRTLGLIVLDVANPFFTDEARGVEDTASAAGLAVILCNSDGKSSKEDAYLELLEEQRVKGVLITPADGISARLGHLRPRGTAVVLLDRRSPRRDQCSVSVDDALGGDLAVTHLVEHGHRRLAFVGDVPDVLVLATSRLNVAAGRRAAAELIALPKARRPTGVFCANDLLALGMLQELTRQGLRVPQDVAIVGYDDIDFAAAAAIPLSSVSQPRHQLGRTAAELLIEETSGGPHRHQQVVFSPELVVRESSALRRRPARRPA
jgi:LacI family transcriptional regulator